MARQQLNPSEQIPTGGIIRSLLNTLTTGNAVITKVFAGNGTTITQTGVDVGTGDVTVNTAIVANQQTTAYPVVAGDLARVLTMKSASSVTVTLPQATGSFASPFWLYIQNAGAGTVSIVPTTSTIDTVASVVLSTNQSVVVVAVGGNYITLRGLSSASGSSGVTNAQSIANSLIFG